MPIAYKKCAQCGCVKTEDDFKIKYKRTDGSNLRNRYCRDCEEDTRNYLALNNLLETHTISAAQEKQLMQYIEAFRILEKQGLSTPLSRNKASTTRKQRRSSLPIDMQLAELTEMVEQWVDTEQPVEDEGPAITTQTPLAPFGDDVPADLQQWLDGSYEEWKDKYEPGYLNDVVYPTLKSVYRKETGWDAVTLTPTYDDTYKAVLNAISDRFWDYEDWYHEQKHKEEN